MFAAGTAAAAGTNQVSTLTPVGLAATEFLNVTIGGTTYSQVENGANTLTDFVAAHALTIRGATGGAANGIIVTAAADMLVFTATGTNTTTNGVMTATGYTFTAPTGTITSAANAGATAGRVLTNVFSSTVVTPAGDFNLAGDTFTVTAGGASAVVTFATDTATSLRLFAAANPTLGGFAVETSATALTLFRSSADTATATASLVTSTAGLAAAGGDGAAAATIGTATDLTTTNTVAGVTAALPTASHSSYLQTGTAGSLVVTSTIDQVSFVNGDRLDLGATEITTTAAAAAGGNAGISATGIVTFSGTPGDFSAALAQVAGGINDGGTAAGEAAVFQFGGKSYVYISDGAAGHSAADLVLEVLGFTGPLLTGLTITGGDIIAIG